MSETICSNVSSIDSRSWGFLRTNRLKDLLDLGVQPILMAHPTPT
jgi:hypothetical protein